jgi:hypothetical protein
LTRRRIVLAAIPGAALTLAGIANAQAVDPAALTFTQLYKSYGIRGYEYSDTLLSLKGRDIIIHGYMAPPLKPESSFFVLTREPVALCPFCQSDAEWPADIVVVYLKSASPLVSAGDSVAVRGRLEVGSWTDPETGFVSQIRVVDAAYRRD